jgi:hypothetical protein
MSKDMLGQVVRALVGVPHEYHGTLLDAVNRLNDRDLANAAKFARNLKLFLRGELSVSEPTRSWREEDGVIYFSVTSDGTTGEEWINRLEGNDFRMINYPKSVLRSPDFKPTTGVTTKIGVLKGMLFSDDDRITKKIRAEADRRTFTKPNAEVACLVRTKFTDPEIEAMGLFGIVVMAIRAS